MELRREKQEEKRTQSRERHRTECLEHLDRLVAVHRDGDADRRDHDHEPECQPPIAAAEELRPCLRCDHAVDRKPTDSKEQREPRADV